MNRETLGSDLSAAWMDSLLVFHQFERAIHDEPNAWRVNLKHLLVRFKRSRLEHGHAILELACRRLDGQALPDILGAIHRDVGRQLLVIARAEQEEAWEEKAGLGAVLAGDPAVCLTDER